MALDNQPHVCVERALRLTDAENETVNAAIAILKKHARAGRPIASWSQLTAYLALTSLSERVEVFRVLFLNNKNALIRDKVMARGTIDHTPVYVSEIIRSAVLLDASAIILCHNHPSGDPAPSKSDIEMTRKIKSACDFIGVTLHDHVVVGFGREAYAVSMRSAGLF